MILLVVLSLYVYFIIPILTEKVTTTCNLNDKGEIGDAIGGMTAPIIGLFSAFLVYLAFREQVKANQLDTLLAIEKSIKDELDNLILISNNETDKPKFGKEAILYLKNNLKPTADLLHNKSDNSYIEFENNYRYYFKPFILNLIDYYNNLLTTLKEANNLKLNQEIKNSFIKKIYNYHFSYLSVINHDKIKNQFCIYYEQYKLKEDSKDFNEINHFLEQFHETFKNIDKHYQYAIHTRTNSQFRRAKLRLSNCRRKRKRVIHHT